MTRLQPRSPRTDEVFPYATLFRAVDKVREREKRVNRYEVEIDERVSLILARHQPTAIDLRTLLAVSKMLTDMERCGDEAEKIANTVRRMYEAEPIGRTHV